MRIVIKTFSLVGLLWLATLSLFGRAEEPHKITCITNITRSVQADTCGAGVGQITLIHDGTPPFTYEWSHDSTLNGPEATGLVGQTAYFVRVTDSAGCVDSATIGLANINPLDLIINTNDVVPDTCGAGVGSITIDLNNIINGSAPFVFQWDSSANNATTPEATNLVAGQYAVDVRDDNGCEASALITVPNETNGFEAETEVFGLDCNGDSSGAAVVRITGGGSINTYAWTPLGDTTVIGTDSAVSGLTAGNYVIQVNGGSGSGACGFTRVVNVPEPEPLEASSELDKATGCSTRDGQAVALVQGGTPPYQIEWNTGSTNDTIFNLQADFYSYTVSDTNGCTSSEVFVLGSLAGPDFEVEILQEDNCGLNEGIARVRIDTGQAPFQVTWWTEPPQPDTSLYAYNLPRLESGSPYYVAVRTIDSCLDQKAFYMPGNDPLSISVVDQQDNYCELANGAITVNIQGGTQPYRYEWSTSPIVTTSTITGLEAGTYTVRVRDSFNCDIDTTLTLIDELGYTLEVETTPETCYADQDGTATAITEGGRPPFTYAWTSSPAQRTMTATNLPGGIYNVAVRDAAGCERRGVATVEGRDPILVDFTSNPPFEEVRVLSNATFTFNSEVDGADSLVWDLGDGNFTSAASPVYTYRDTGDYFVELKAYNTNSGCVDSVAYGPYQVVSDGLVFIPNAFTPNDDDFNDSFEIKGSLIEEFDLQIFSRWGSVVFSSQSRDDAWNGTINGGRAAPAGIYIYKLVATLSGGIPYEATGTIMLVR